MAVDAELWQKCLERAERDRLPEHEGEYVFTVQQEARLLYLIATAPSLAEQVRKPVKPPPLAELTEDVVAGYESIIAAHPTVAPKDAHIIAVHLHGIVWRSGVARDKVIECWRRMIDDNKANPMDAVSLTQGYFVP